MQLERSFPRSMNDPSVKLYADALGTVRQAKSSQSTPRSSVPRKHGRRPLPLLQSSHGGSSRKRLAGESGLALASPVQWGVLPDTSALGDVGDAITHEEIESDDESDVAHEEPVEVSQSSQRSWIPTKRQALPMTSSSTARRSYQSSARHDSGATANAGFSSLRRRNPAEEDEEEEEEEQEGMEEEPKSSPPSQVMAVRRKRLSALVPDQIITMGDEHEAESNDDVRIM